MNQVVAVSPPIAPPVHAEPRNLDATASAAAAEAARWRAEVVRLREMIASLETQRGKLGRFVKLGALLALPTAYFHWLAPLGVFVFGLITYGTGQYFSWGHLMDRRQQLSWAHAQLRRARSQAGLPAEDESLKLPRKSESDADEAAQAA